MLSNNLFFFSTNKGGYCPNGYFLQGIDRSRLEFLHNIEHGKCCKPASHPRHYDRCYDHDVKNHIDSKGMSKCDDGYFITGLYKGNCNTLSCIETFRCCKMVQGKYKKFNWISLRWTVSTLSMIPSLKVNYSDTLYSARHCMWEGSSE